MPALPPVPKVMRVDLFQTCGSNTRVRNRMFYQFSGAMSATDMTTVLNTISSSWTSHMATLQSNTCTLTGLEGTDLTSNTGAQVTITASSTGGGATQQMPNGTAVVIRFKIARRYRGGHPRFYLAGVAVSGVQNGEVINPTTLAACVSGFQGFNTTNITTPPAAVGTLTHVNVSYKQGFTNITFPSGRTHPVPTNRVTPLIDPVIGYSGNPNVGSQRRRSQQSV